MRLLLISNSTNAGEEYLDYPKQNIKEFLGAKKITALFIPFAGVTVSYDDYEAKVKLRFNEIGHDIVSIHHFDDKIEAVKNAEAIVVGGGNTWELTRKLHDYDLVFAIQTKVKNSAPYIGWSAGSNVACPTIKTTNDMPIVDPNGFDVMNLVPFQINPHYLDKNPEGHGGETREDRIMEFLELNQDVYVVGLREGTMLLYENNKLLLIGEQACRVFKYRNEPVELKDGNNLDFLMRR